MQTDFSGSLYVNNFGLFLKYLQHYVNKLGALFKFKEYVDIFIFQSCWPGYDLPTHVNLPSVVRGSYGSPVFKVSAVLFRSASPLHHTVASLSPAW